MATLVSRISDLTIALRTKINAMMPRLLPSGGTIGQVLTKNSTTDFAVSWATVGSGGETGGNNGGAAQGSYRGVFGSDVKLTTQTFGSGVVPSWTFSNPPSIVNQSDGASATSKALTLAPQNPAGSSTQWLEFKAYANSTFNTLTIRYLLESEANYDFLRILVDGVVLLNRAGIFDWQTFTTSLSPGLHTVRIDFSNDTGTIRGFNNVRLSTISFPEQNEVSPFVYGDTVTHSGSEWFCAQPGTAAAPGANADWLRFG